MTKTRSQEKGAGQQGTSPTIAPQGGEPTPTTNLNIVVVDKMTIKDRVNAFLGEFTIENRDSAKVLVFKPCSYSKEAFDQWLETQAKQFDGMPCQKEYTHAFLKAYVLFTATQLGFKSTDLPVNMPFPLQEQIQAACLENKVINGDLWEALAKSASKKVGSAVYFDVNSKNDTDFPQLLLAMISLVLDGIDLLQKRTIAVQPLLTIHNQLVDSAVEIVSLQEDIAYGLATQEDLRTEVEAYPGIMENWRKLINDLTMLNLDISTLEAVRLAGYKEEIRPLTSDDYEAVIEELTRGTTHHIIFLKPTTEVKIRNIKTLKDKITAALKIRAAMGTAEAVVSSVTKTDTSEEVQVLTTTTSSATSKPPSTQYEKMCKIFKSEVDDIFATINMWKDETFTVKYSDIDV